MKKKMWVLSFLLTIVFQFSCRQPNSSEKIYLSGIIDAAKHLEGKYIYIEDLAERNIIRDSALVLNNKFRFSVPYDSSFTPFRVRLLYKDTVTDKKILDSYQINEPIIYNRPFGLLSKIDTNFIQSSFYVDLDYPTVIIPSYKYRSVVRSPLHQFASESPQNEAFYKRVILSWDSMHKNEAIKKNIKLIRKYNSSYYLLDQLYKMKQHFDVKEVKQQISFFSENISGSPNFIKFEHYFQYLAQKRKTNLIILEDKNGERRSIFSPNSRLQVLIFWASWCGPCRKEIPELKKVFNDYHDKGISFASISIDKNKYAWHMALNQEKMMWDQFVVNPDNELDIELKYNISAIPRILLIKHNNEIVADFLGMDTIAYTKMINTLNTFSK